MRHIIHNHPEHPPAHAEQPISGVARLLACTALGAEDQDADIRDCAENLRIGHRAHRWRIDHHMVVAIPQCREHLQEQLTVEDLGRVGGNRPAGQDVQVLDA